MISCHNNTTIPDLVRPIMMTVPLIWPENISKTCTISFKESFIQKEKIMISVKSDLIVALNSWTFVVMIVHYISDISTNSAFF